VSKCTQIVCLSLSLCHFTYDCCGGGAACCRLPKMNLLQTLHCCYKFEINETRPCRVFPNLIDQPDPINPSSCTDSSLPAHPIPPDLVTIPPVPTSDLTCGDFPQTLSSLSSLHQTPIEIDPSELARRIQNQPDEEPFLTPSGSFTAIGPQQKESGHEEEEDRRFQSNAIIVRHEDDDDEDDGANNSENTQQPHPATPPQQQTGDGGAFFLPQTTTHTKTTSDDGQRNQSKIADAATEASYGTGVVTIESDISVLYKSPVHHSGSGTSTMCVASNHKTQQKGYQYEQGHSEGTITERIQVQSCSSGGAL
jgi:hypothetical protein